MIPFRTHVVSLVAVLLALAAGVALGGGPLSEVGRGALTSAPAGEQPQEEEGRAATFGDRFAVTSAAKLYAGGLDTHPVAVVTLPGAPQETVRGVAAEVEKAGGSVTATYAAEPALLEPAEKSLVDTLGSQLMTQLGSGAADRSATTYERLGQLWGSAIATTRESGAAPDADTSSIRQSLDGAGLVAAPDGDPRRAALVVVVLGGDVDDDVLAGLLAGLASRSVGVVAVADTDSGDVASLRASPLAADVATVDGAETNLGRVTATLALIRSLKTPGGSFGASGADGAVPLG